MCKQRTVLETIKTTNKEDLPDWYIMHATAQAEDYDSSVRRDKEIMEKVNNLITRFDALEQKVDRFGNDIQEIKELITGKKMKEKAFVFDNVVAFFKSEKFWRLVLIGLAFAIGAGKDAILKVIGL